MEQLAIAFIENPKPLETYKLSNAYVAMSKLHKGEKLTRYEKDYITRETNFSLRGKKVCVMGWAFDFKPYMKRYVVKSYGHWEECWAFDKSSVRFTFGTGIDEIHEITR